MRCPLLRGTETLTMRCTVNYHPKRFWTALGKTLNAWTAKARESHNYDKTLLIEHTGFFPRHTGMRGPNHNESSLIDFGTRLIEANAVHFAYSTFGSVTLYIDSTIYSHENAGTYIEYRLNGKTEYFTLYDRTNESDSTHYQLQRLLGHDTKVKTNLFQHREQDELKEAMERAGAKILVFFRFNALITVNIPHHGSHFIGKPEYIKESKRGVEIGWISSGTYNGLPNVVKVSKVKTLPVVRLDTLGIERTGYYDHHYKCAIPKAQAKQARAFFARRFRDAA
jgi:hypothetical protein